MTVSNSHENWHTWSTLPQVPTEIFNLIMIIVSSGTHITFIILQVNNVSFSSIIKTGSRTYQSYEIMNIAYILYQIHIEVTYFAERMVVVNIINYSVVVCV